MKAAKLLSIAVKCIGIAALLVLATDCKADWWWRFGAWLAVVCHCCVMIRKAGYED